jgi:hypothetical protein
MTATFKIIKRTVGEKGQTHGSAVLRIQQLLTLNKYKLVCNGVWDAKTRDALQAFQERLRQEEGARALDYGFSTPVRPYVVPNDLVLFELAYRAGVLIRLAPGHAGESGFLDVHDWCVKHKVGFDWNHAVWGLDGYIMWAVVTVYDEKRCIPSMSLTL